MTTGLSDSKVHETLHSANLPLSTSEELLAQQEGGREADRVNTRYMRTQGLDGRVGKPHTSQFDRVQVLGHVDPFTLP